MLLGRKIAEVFDKLRYLCFWHLIINIMRILFIANLQSGTFKSEAHRCFVGFCKFNLVLVNILMKFSYCVEVEYNFNVLDTKLYIALHSTYKSLYLKVYCTGICL